MPLCTTPVWDLTPWSRGANKFDGRNLSFLKWNTSRKLFICHSVLLWTLNLLVIVNIAIEDKASRENFVLIVQFSIVGGTFLDYEEVFQKLYQAEKKSLYIHVCDFEVIIFDCLFYCKMKTGEAWAGKNHCNENFISADFF